MKNFTWLSYPWFWAAWVRCFTSFTSPHWVLTSTDVSSCQLWVADHHDTSSRSLCVQLRRSNVCIKKKKQSSRFSPFTHKGQSGKTCHSCYSWNWVYESNLKLCHCIYFDGSLWEMEPAVLPGKTHFDNCPPASFWTGMWAQGAPKQDSTCQAQKKQHQIYKSSKAKGGTTN